MNTKITIGVVVFVLILIAAYFLVVTPAQAPQTGDISTTSAPTSTDAGKTMQIKLALLDTTGNGTGKSRGCDTVSMVTRTVPQTSQVLTSALNALWTEPEGAVPSTQYNFIARTKDTLKFDHATVTNGTASIYLTGALSELGGVCDDPRAQIQLEETALQFPTVQKVQLYLNGKATTLTPSEKGD